MKWFERANQVLRFKTSATTWVDRTTEEVSALSDLRQHAGFAALEDRFEAEFAALFFQWLETSPDEPGKLADLHGQGRAIQRMVKVLDASTRAKESMEAQQAALKEDAARIMAAQQTNTARRRSMLDTVRTTRQHV